MFRLVMNNDVKIMMINKNMNSGETLRQRLPNSYNIEKKNYLKFLKLFSSICVIYV
jgi:hypothetical protein